MSSLIGSAATTTCGQGSQVTNPIYPAPTTEKSGPTMQRILNLAVEGFWSTFLKVEVEVLDRSSRHQVVTGLMIEKYSFKMNNLIQGVSSYFCNLLQAQQKYPAMSVINVTKRFQKRFSQTTRCLIVAVSSRIKHRINQTVVSSLVHMSVSRLLILLDEHAKSLQTHVFFIICTFASLMCKKKKKNTTKQKHWSAQHKMDPNGNHYFQPLGENYFLLVERKRHK